MMHTLTRLRRRLWLAVAIIGLIVTIVPLFTGPYFTSLLVLVLLSAYFGQSWNVMTGFTGQLSLGHALYVGIGAYTSGALFVHYGLSPWLGVWIGMAAAALMGGVIAALGFRFGVTGVYFALLTIAFAEFTRILFDHFAWVGGSSGLFLPVVNRTHDDFWQLRGSPRLFYYVLLVLNVAVLSLTDFLLRLRVGYYWLAIREDQQAADALGIDVFRYKLLAVALSAALTAIGGTVTAFYDNNLYPDSVFSIARSIDILTAPIIGGLGTLVGPIVGAVVLTVMGEVLTNISAEIGINGLKQLFYGAALLFIVMMQPRGLWPWAKSKLGLGRELS